MNIGSSDIGAMMKSQSDEYWPPMPTWKREPNNSVTQLVREARFPEKMLLMASAVNFVNALFVLIVK
jgi:hypothetical protein